MPPRGGHVPGPINRLEAEASTQPSTKSPSHAACWESRRVDEARSPPASSGWRLGRDDGSVRTTIECGADEVISS